MNVYRKMELSPMYTLSICSDTVIDQSGVYQRHISSGYRIWRESAERTFGFLLMKVVDFTRPNGLFGLV
jgi:hypothetical protein